MGKPCFMNRVLVEPILEASKFLEKTMFLDVILP